MLRPSPLTTSYQPKMPVPAPAKPASKEPSKMTRVFQAIKGIFVKQKPKKKSLASQGSLPSYGSTDKA